MEGLNILKRSVEIYIGQMIVHLWLDKNWMG
jgi:hypothetical protein